MFFLFLVVVAAAGIGIYLLFILNLVPGAAEERIGVLEPLPPDTGTWKADTDSDAARAVEAEGLTREVRYYFYEGESRLVLQARYKSRETKAIVRADPDTVVKRRRIRK